MKCPIDNTELAMTERQGIEIDYCPRCRGVWLDRGELDKIIERSNDDDDDDRRKFEQSHRPEPYRGDRDHYRPRRKKSLLGEIFDF